MPHIDKKQPRRAYLPKRERRTSETDDGVFLNSTRWRRTASIQRHSFPICQNCDYHDRITPGQVVDHIIPRSQNGALLDFRNLMTLCHSCHDRKSGKESHKPVLIESKETHRGDLIPVNREDIYTVLK